MEGNAIDWVDVLGLARLDLRSKNEEILNPVRIQSWELLVPVTFKREIVLGRIRRVKIQQRRPALDRPIRTATWLGAFFILEQSNTSRLLLQLRIERFPFLH